MDAGFDFQGQRFGIANDGFFSHAEEVKWSRGSLRGRKSRGFGWRGSGHWMLGLLRLPPAIY